MTEKEFGGRFSIEKKDKGVFRMLTSNAAKCLESKPANTLKLVFDKQTSVNNYSQDEALF